ncbi:MAG: GGDEF domain-containing protein [Gammaproteobacteria bacterium]|nr:GGDEF domain-containing protein [Gammaproteobacteria bacterium]
MPWSRRLSTKIGVLVLGAMLVASLVVTGVSTHATGQFLKQKVAKEFPLRLNTVAAQVELWYAERTNELLVFAQSPALVRLLHSPRKTVHQNNLAKFIGHLLARSPSFEALFILDPKGQPIVWEGPQFPLPPRLPQLSPVSEDTVVISNATVLEQGVVQFLYRQVTDKGQPLGVLYGVLKLESLDGVLAASTDTETTHLTLTDSAGSILASNTTTKPGTRFARIAPRKPAPPTIEYYSADGHAMVGAAVLIEKLDGSLHIEQPYAETFKPVITTIVRTLLLSSVVILLLVIAAYLITRAAMKPVSALLQAVKNSSADQQVVTVPEFKDKTEIGALARAFNSMATRLNEKTREVEDANTKLRAQNEQLEILSTTDALTQLHNRRFFHDQLKLLQKQSQRTAAPLSLMLIDIDNFKGCNDQFGHKRGDEVLIEVARVLRRETRETDVVARIGGDEFAILALGSELAGASQLGTKITGEIRAHFRDSGVDHCECITVSVGVAVLEENGEKLLEDADRALYSAKRAGRDRAHSSHDPAVNIAPVVPIQTPAG